MKIIAVKSQSWHNGTVDFKKFSAIFDDMALPEHIFFMESKHQIRPYRGTMAQRIWKTFQDFR